MDKNVHIAIQIEHKDDSVNHGEGAISYSDYQWGNSRFLYHSNPNNEHVLFKDCNTTGIEEMMSDIIIRGKDKNNLYDPSLVYLYQFDDDGNAFYSDQVINKWKEWIKTNGSKTKPHLLYTYENGLEIGVTPFFHEHTVFTTVRFTGDKVDYANIGKLTEALLEQFVNIENNLTFRVIKLYDKCMKAAHEMHLSDINQDAVLTDIWGRLTDTHGVVQGILDWLPNIEYFKYPSVGYDINLAGSDPNYLYKYVLSCSDLTPAYKTSVACETAPVSYSELAHTRDGILMKAMIKSFATTTYTRRDIVDAQWGGQNGGASFSANPTTPVEAASNPFGDADNYVRRVTGSVSTTLRSGLRDDVYIDMPWLQVYVDCYTYSGSHVKTVTGTWDRGGTTLHLGKHELNGTFGFSANLGGDYRCRVRVKIFWGTFGSWTDEVLIAYFGLSRGNNSGGYFNLNKFIFDGKSNRVLTRYELESASKYEKSTYINGTLYGWSASFNPPLGPDKQHSFEVPRSANYHYTRWYGRFINSKEPVQSVSWMNESKTGVTDMSGSLHFPDAHKYSIITSFNFTATYYGQKAVYVQDTYNTPYLFAPIHNDCTIMLRGGYRYKLISDCRALNIRQVGVHKMGVGVINIVCKGSTLFYGDMLKLQSDFILKSSGTRRSYRMMTMGQPPSLFKLASGVPNPELTTTVRRSRRSLVSPLHTKPEAETGMGYITSINLIDASRLDEVTNKWVIIKTGNNKTVEFKLPHITTTAWKQVYNKDGQRVYAILENEYLYFMTYYIDRVDSIVIQYSQGNTMELVLKDTDSGLITHAFELNPYKPENSIPVSVDDKTYYLEVTSEKPNKDNEEPVVLRDEKDEIIGYLK